MGNNKFSNRDSKYCEGVYKMKVEVEKVIKVRACESKKGELFYVAEVVNREGEVLSIASGENIFEGGRKEYYYKPRLLFVV